MKKEKPTPTCKASKVFMLLVLLLVIFMSALGYIVYDIVNTTENNQCVCPINIEQNSNELA